MLLCILCLLFQVLKSVINKLFHYAPVAFALYLNEPDFHFKFSIHPSSASLEEKYALNLYELLYNFLL